MTIEETRTYMDVIKLMLTACEARCLLEYFAGSRGKEQRAVYAEFRERLGQQASRGDS